MFQTDVPSAPDAPEISNITAESVNLTWSPPSSDGGAPISGYMVEMRQTTSPRWVKATITPIPDTKFKATRLLKGEEYEFRVAAVNRAGTGEPSEPSQSVVAENPAGMKF